MTIVVEFSTHATSSWLAACFANPGDLQPQFCKALPSLPSYSPGYTQLRQIELLEGIRPDQVNRTWTVPRPP